MIVIPALIWKAAIDGFTAQSGLVERVAFLDGVAAGPKPADGGVVTTAVFPNATESEGQWRVGSSDMSRVGRHLRGYRLVRLAQVHTHPGPWTGHSGYDDDMAFSQQAGTVSIVLPSHAMTYPGLGDAGVHYRGQHDWRELDPDEVGDYVRLVPSVLDDRRRR